jgi:hypothetical protein
MQSRFGSQFSRRCLSFPLRVAHGSVDWRIYLITSHFRRKWSGSESRGCGIWFYLIISECVHLRRKPSIYQTPGPFLSFRHIVFSWLRKSLPMQLIILCFWNSQITIMGFVTFLEWILTFCCFRSLLCSTRQLELLYFVC